MQRPASVRQCLSREVVHVGSEDRCEESGEGQAAGAVVATAAGRVFALCCPSLMTCAGARPLAAEDGKLSEGRAEFEKAVESLRPRHSLDTTPVEFSVGGSHYRMPRNYLVTMDNWNGGPQGLVTVRVNLPDLKPISDETRACFTARVPSQLPNCEPFSFTLNAPGGPSSEEAFSNLKPHFRNREPEQGPFGFEKYEIGPDNARGEFYRKVDDGRMLLYSCWISDNYGKRDGICAPDSDRLSTGVVIHFFFKLDKLRDIARIDARLHELVKHFAAEGDHK